MSRAERRRKSSRLGRDEAFRLTHGRRETFTLATTRRDVEHQTVHVIPPEEQRDDRVA